MKVSIFLLAAIAASQCASAEPIGRSGNQILESCRRYSMLEPPTSTGDALFIGDCAGMTRTLVAIGSHLSARGRFCVPGAVTFQQAGKVLVGFLDAHPERLQELSTVLAIDAFRAAWPCKSK